MPPSTRPNSSKSAATTSNSFHSRRQERLRGTGKHEIIPIQYNFGRRSSSIASSTSTPVQQQSSTQGTSISSTPIRPVSRNGGPSSAMSVRSGRGGLVPSSSPSKYIDPLLLADQSHLTHNKFADSSVNGRLVGSGIDQHRQERLRGAGTHQIQPRFIQFSKPRASDATSSDSSRDIMSSPGFPVNGTPIEINSVVGKGKVDFVERLMERRKGAGTHQIEQSKIQFGKMRASDAASSDSGRDATPSSGLLDLLASSIEQTEELEQENGTGKVDLEQRRLQRRKGAGTHAIEEIKAVFGRLSQRSDTPSSMDIVNEGEEADRTLTGQFSPPGESTPRGVSGQMLPFGSFEVGQEYDVVDLDQQDETASQAAQSPGSMAAQRNMAKRQTKRQGSPLRDTLRKTKSVRRIGSAGSKKGPPRRLIDLGMFNEADETIAGQADETLQDMREAAFTAPKPPSWTFPKQSMTKEELAAMKAEVQEMVTLALGNEAGAVRTVKVNDADVLWSVLKKEIYSSSQLNKPSSATSTLLNQLSDSLLSTFTLLSQQSAERSQLILHLTQARRRNLHIRKQVFDKTQQVKQVQRKMQVIKRLEMKRVQQEEEEESSMKFLSQLQKASQEWC